MMDNFLDIDLDIDTDSNMDVNTDLFYVSGSELDSENTGVEERAF